MAVLIGVVPLSSEAVPNCVPIIRGNCAAKASMATLTFGNMVGDDSHRAETS